MVYFIETSNRKEMTLHIWVIIYRENILMTGNTIKLADFGFCLHFKKDKRYMKRIGSPLYMAPEMLFSIPYDSRIDLYSLGVLMYEILFG